MFFSNSFCFFFCFGIVVAYCDVGCLYCFLVALFACGIFVCSLCLPQKKTCATCGKKHETCTRIARLPPKALVDLWFWFVFFSIFFLHVLNWVHVSWVLFTTERTVNHMTKLKKKQHYFSHGNTRLMLRNMHFVKLCPTCCMWLPLDQTTYKTLFSKLLKPSNIFKHFQILCQNHVKSMDVSLEARRRCSMLLRGAVSLWSSSSWNLALRWGRRVRTASASTARARGILGRSDGWCMLMFQCITLIMLQELYLSLHRVAFMPNSFWF